MKIISKRSFPFLIFTSLILFILSFIFFVFVNNDQINTSPYYTGEGGGYADLTTITQKESWSGKSLHDKTELVVKEIIEDSFKAQTDNLGIIAIPFDTHGRSINETIVFRVKETNNKNWYYQNIYNAKQFQDNAPFPFGFPIITNSKSKSYTFQIEALTGKPNNSISLSKTNTFFFSKYKFTKETLLKNPLAFSQFLNIKMNTRLALLSNREITIIILFGFSPFIYYFCKYLFKKLLLLKENTAFLRSLNPKKYVFYITTISGILLFLINGLITRGHNFFNLFFIPSQNVSFMDFYNPLSELFDGPYSHGSIYPPLPLLILKLMLRLIPYDIAGKGPSVIRASQSGEIVFLLYMLITLLAFFILLMEIKKGSKVEKYIFTIVILLSAPFLFQFERANIIFVALIFLMIFIFFKDNNNRFIREVALISLGVSAGIKIYPVVFVILLIKEKRFKDAIRVLTYVIALFILPFFMLGGINQLPILVKNVLSTSDETTKWGFGYMVNIQNMTRIFFGFLGYFGNSPIIIGRILSLVVLVLGLAAVFIERSKWKTTAILTLLMILVPNVSYVYALIFMLIPLIMFLDHEEKEKPSDYLYLFCFILIFIPLALGGIDILNNAFRQKQFLPITYGVVIQNIAMLIMASCLVRDEWLDNKLKHTRNFLQALMLKISNLITKADKFYWAIPVFIILVYNLIFFNKYYPITEGWFSAYAWLFNNGQFPYKDFYFFLTPLYLIKMSIFTAIFGYNILYLRIFGILVILLTTYFLYKNLQIIFGSTIASFVSIVGMIYYQSGVAHITYDFTQFVALYGLIQSYFLLKYINSSGDKTATSKKWLFLAGLFAGLTFLIKHSNGTLITAFSFTGLFFVSLPKGKNVVLRASILYICGFAAPLIITAFWLLANSAFTQFWEQAFSGAVSAKGGLLYIFFGWFREILTYDFLARFREILFLVVIFGYWLYPFKKKKMNNENINRLLMLITSFFILGVVLLPLFTNTANLNKLSRLGQMGVSNIGVASISTSIILIATAILFLLLKKPFNRSLVLLSFISLGFIYGTGTSAGLSEAGVFIGFCIFIGLMLHYRSIWSLGKLFIILFCISFSLFWIEVKYERPYYWWNATSTDIRGKLQLTNKISALQGMYTSADNIKLIEEVTKEIKSGSRPGEPVFTFPNIPTFYLLADRKPPGKTIVHWFDFLPDELALKEAEAIKKNPPKVIVYFDLGPSVWKAHEELFRDNKPSGQRKIVEAFMGVIKSKKMHISKKYELPNNVKLTVWKN